MHKFKYSIAAFVIVLSLLASACPSQKDLDRMASASRELSHDVLTIEKAVSAVYASGHITQARKNSYAAKLKDIATKGAAFNAILVDLDKRYPSGTVPPTTLQTLQAEFVPLSALVSSIIADLTSDGLKQSGNGLASHTKTISDTLGK